MTLPQTVFVGDDRRMRVCPTKRSADSVALPTLQRTKMVSGAQKCAQRLDGEHDLPERQTRSVGSVWNQNRSVPTYQGIGNVELVKSWTKLNGNAAHGAEKFCRTVRSIRATTGEIAMSPDVATAKQQTRQNSMHNPTWCPANRHKRVHATTASAQLSMQPYTLHRTAHARSAKSHKQTWMLTTIMIAVQDVPRAVSVCAGCSVLDATKGLGCFEKMWTSSQMPAPIWLISISCTAKALVANQNDAD